MKLTILKPYDKEVHSVAWLEVNTNVGNFVLQKGHAPMILMLAKDRQLSYCLDNGQQINTTISGGILKIDREQVTIVLEK
jgi:F0F1-type ATP synthase epsilon subunit